VTQHCSFHALGDPTSGEGTISLGCVQKHNLCDVTLKKFSGMSSDSSIQILNHVPTTKDEMKSEFVTVCCEQSRVTCRTLQQLFLAPEKRPR
jgi:hypothetical protein